MSPSTCSATTTGGRPASAGPSPELAAEQAESIDPPEPDGLADLLATLPRQQRVAVALYYVDGLSVAEVAAAMGLAEGSVKSHLHDARRRLRAVLDREGR